MQITLDALDVLEINGNKEDYESVLVVEKGQTFQISINRKFKDIVKINYYEETPIS